MVHLEAAEFIVQAHQKRKEVNSMFNIRYLKSYTKHHFICCFAVFSLVSSCKSPDKLIGDSNVFGDTNIEDSDIDPEDDPSSFSSVSDLFSGDIEEGDLITLTDIVVTSPSDDDGFFVGDQSGGSNSGIFVQADFEQKSAFDVSIGQTVNIEGTYLEIEEPSGDSTGYDNTLSTLSISNVADVAVTGESQTPVQAVPFVSTTSEEIESYEGVLVSIVSPSVTKIEGIGLIYLNDVLVLNNRYYAYSEMELVEGTVNEIIGIIGYEDGNYVLYPRSVDDIDYTYAETPTVELYFTEFFVGNPASDGNCIPNFEWYIEVHYPSVNTTDLNAINGNIYISNENDSQNYLQYSRISVVEPISPGESFILITSNSSNCLNNPATDFPVKSVELIDVDGGNGLSDVERESTFKLMFSENDASMVNGDYVVLNEVIIDVPFGLNSFELSTLATPEESNILNPNNGFWTESTTPLINGDNTPLVNNAGAALHGSPGTMDFHSSQ
jgi:hypothetical protein